MKLWVKSKTIFFEEQPQTVRAKTNLNCRIYTVDKLGSVKLSLICKMLCSLSDISLGSQSRTRSCKAATLISISVT